MIGWLLCAGVHGDEGLSRVASLVRSGDDRDALQSVEQLAESVRREERVRYLEGRLLLRLGRPCDAKPLLSERFRELPEAMRNDARRRSGRAAARCGECDEAREILLGSSASDVETTRVDRAIAADCALRAGDVETAASELARLTRSEMGLSNRVALLVELSDAYRTLERRDDARAAALEAWKSAVSVRDRQLVSPLESRAAPTLADRIDRAANSMSARRFEQAVVELEAIEPGKDLALSRRWHHTYGMALFRMRTRYLDAARVLYESSQLGGPHEIEDAFHSARALSRADKDARAIRAYRRFAARYPKSKRAPEARFLAAWLEMRLGRSNGEAQMQRLVTGRRQVRGRWRRSALWELGFRAFETKRYSRAARFLEQYVRLATTGMDRARGHYWLGRSYRWGKKAVGAYRNAIEVEPLHWYAVLAAQRLRRLDVAPPEPFDDASSPNSVELPDAPLPLPETFLVYSSIGLDPEGVAWLTRHESELVAGVARPERVPALARLYRDAGAYREAMRISRKKMAFLQSDPADHRWWWDAAYPMPWLEDVDRHRGDVPRALVYATMRQESGFQPEVISRAGAVGLMQVMPELASKIEGERISRRQLQSPDVNIALGLREMNALAEQFDHVYPLSIAAYNAGTKRVRRWLSESGRMELDRFVERIPFNETRNYVRRVTTHFARYSYLDDPSAGWPTLPRFVTP